MDLGALMKLHALYAPVLIGPRGALGPLYLPRKLRGSAYPLQWGEGPLSLGGALFSLLPAAAGAPSRWVFDKGIGGWGAFCVLMGGRQIFISGAQGYSRPLLLGAAAAARQQRLAAEIQQQEGAIRDKYEALWGPLETDDPTPQAKEMGTEIAASRHKILLQQQSHLQQQQQQQRDTEGEGGDRGIDLALLPIGGYEPAPLLQRFHMTPEEAVEVRNNPTDNHHRSVEEKDTGGEEGVERLSS